MKKTVCLVGRPNVGKSTIFNKLIKEQKSIILDTPGVTRDRIYGDVTYGDKKFLLIDTGGIDLGQGDFNKDIKAQAEIAIEESDVIVFVLDGREDITSNDLAVMDDVRWQMEDGNYYDLQGRKVEKPNRKGIYIKNGQKVIVR